MADAPLAVVVAQPVVIVTEPRRAPAAVVATGPQGAAGPPGQPGPAGGSAVQRIAGETLSALRLVYELNDEVFYLGGDDAAHVDLVCGVTITAAVLGQPINVQSSGPLDDVTWSWAPGPVWLGADGHLIQAPPEAGYLLYVGRAVSSTRLIININQPVELAME
ncbi:hypothetical protein ACPA5B_11580 [Pseudomonas solani]|uniref:hypothetical protein n=1 Tax=Pseudomonas solani TaxID=2731552 RepID=UPI003C2C5A17